MEEDKTYQVLNNHDLAACDGGTPPSGGGSAEAIGGGGGSGEVHDSNNNNVNGSIPGVLMKRKRGRPRKFPAEAQPVLVIASSQLGLPNPNSIQQPLKCGRGRPKGSVKRHILPLSPPPPGAGFEEEGKYGYGVDLIPHILPIYPGEGLFEILTLNGTFTCVGTKGSYHRRGMLTVSLSKPNGEVFGGCVSGPIIAAGPIQLILCSFDQVRRPPNQSRNYPVPHLPDAATPPPPVAATQVPVAKASDQIHEADQDNNCNNNVSSLKQDKINPNAPVAPISSDPKLDHASSALFLGVPASPQSTADQPLADQIIEASFDNPDTSVRDQ
ncbi:hypothetical protein QQ045_029108 [Rhodiola kirilowii]